MFALWTMWLRFISESIFFTKRFSHKILSCGKRSFCSYSGTVRFVEFDFTTIFVIAIARFARIANALNNAKNASNVKTYLCGIRQMPLIWLKNLLLHDETNKNLITETSKYFIYLVTSIFAMISCQFNSIEHHFNMIKTKILNVAIRNEQLIETLTWNRSLSLLYQNLY